MGRKDIEIIIWRSKYRVVFELFGIGKLEYFYCSV